MRPPIPLADHLSVDEIDHRYRHAQRPSEVRRWQVIRLRAQGRSVAEVAEIVGYSHEQIRRIVKAYNDRGPEGVRDQRHDHPGPKLLLNPEQVAELRAALAGPAPDGGAWSCRKVAAWMSERLGREVVDQRGWDYLRRLGHGSASARRAAKRSL